MIFKPLNIPTAATNNAIVAGSGVLHTIVVNFPVASATITVYDALTATGTKIATITLPATLLNQGPMYVNFDCIFAVGLTIVTTGTNFDITVNYTKGIPLS
uniref:Pol-like polyprotein n=1 Tax=uncultured marine virus TaxID=186617 RepID=A0A0F7L9H8_9VIRU|nr:pol-like polyprotein [uncultured marine virus]